MPPYRDSMDLQNVIETIPALVLCALPDGTVEFLNRAWQEYTGYSPQQLTDSGWRSLVHADDLPNFLTEWNVALLAGRPFETEARIRRSDGLYHWFLIKKTLAVSGTRNGQPSLRTLIAFEDINDRKQSQMKLQQSEARYRLLIETLSDAVISVSDGGVIQYANLATARIFGYETIELIGEPFTVLMPEFMRKHHEHGFRRYLATGRRHLDWQGTELIGLHKNGQEFPVEISIGEIVTEGRRTFTGIIRDVSARKKAEENLRRSETYLAEAQNVTHTGSCAIDGTSRQILYWSDEMFRLFGFDPGEGLPCWDQWVQRIHPGDLDKFQGAGDRTFREKAHCDVEFRIVKPDGTIRYIHAIGHPILSPRGELVQVIGTMVDVTERRRAEEERERLRQAQADLAHINRVSTMGELTAALTHEVKQPISAAVTNAKTCMRWLSRDQPDLAEACEAASRLINDVNRASDIISRIGSLFKKGLPQREIVDINEIIREMIALLRSEAARHAISIHSDLASDVPPILVDRVQLQQVLMNLMLNGIEAMADLSTPGGLTIRSQHQENGQLLISLSDVGTGIKPEDAEQIFDAFFTSKPQGTGMGLAISRSIIESHGGRLWATPNSGPGTTFQFTLPIEASASEAA